jgi:hypothetical protein
MPSTSLAYTAQLVMLAGGARPGAGRPAGSPNKVGRELRAAASEHTDAALSVLVALMNDETQPGAVRVSAANALLDRGHGRAVAGIMGVARDGD